MKKPINVCSRCGKPRIAVKSWVELIKTYSGEYSITHTINVCPDPECQQKVDTEIAMHKKRVETLMQERQAREEERKKTKKSA